MIIWVFILFTIMPTITIASTDNDWTRLVDISDDVLEMVKQERYDTAKKLLDQFSEEFYELDFFERTYTMDELRIMTVTHSNALHAIATSSIPHHIKVDKAIQFRLVIDAIRSEYNPLWGELEHTVMGKLGNVMSSYEQKQSNEYSAHLTEFFRLYEMIHPSLMISVDPTIIQTLDSHISWLDKVNAEAVSSVEAGHYLALVDSELQSIFDGVEEDEADPSLYWVIITTGSIIIATLTYVGWKKYKATRQRERSRQKN
ncbi:sporulation protein YpjB [Bacillus sp. HMF5848]|uniref:sporulation protein YpjB n=1 Tax=Bacillus sp. HMF5848 TaxID=2495421 RepID=UPI00163A2D8F|nr:sporulation protein YpjB [Bacillus sp. HMF5848]